MLFEEFLEARVRSRAGRLDLAHGPAQILLHGHCHQKAMGRLAPAKALLSRIPGATVVDLDAGCCGMAGSFGYAREHYEVSRAIGERRLLPAARGLGDGRVLVASGTSCRHQVADFTGTRALHAAELIRSLMRNRSREYWARRQREIGDPAPQESLAILSVCALALAVLVSCISRLNVGVLAVALAWIVGVYIGGLPVATIMNGFPSQLFLTLTGVTLLFALAETNGTLERIAHHAVRLCRGNRGNDSDHVLRARRRAGVDGSRQHRHGGAARTAGDGHGRARRAFRCS